MKNKELKVKQMKFACKYKTDRKYRKIVDKIHYDNLGTDSLNIAKLWYSPVGYNKMILVEHRILTKGCEILNESDDDADWLIAYEVKNEKDENRLNELLAETIDSEASLSELKESMADFAERVYAQCCCAS